MRQISQRSISEPEQPAEELDDVLEELKAMEIEAQQPLRASQPLLKLEIKGFDLAKLGSPEVFCSLMADLHQSGALQSLIYFGIIGCNLSSQISNDTIENSFFTSLLPSSPHLLELQLSSNRLSFTELQQILQALLSTFQPSLFHPPRLVINFNDSDSKWPI
jgi:hypothetical protein